MEWATHPPSRKKSTSQSSPQADLKNWNFRANLAYPSPTSSTKKSCRTLNQWRLPSCINLVVLPTKKISFSTKNTKLLLLIEFLFQWAFFNSIKPLGSSLLETSIPFLDYHNKHYSEYSEVNKAIWFEILLTLSYIFYIYKSKWLLNSKINEEKGAKKNVIHINYILKTFTVYPIWSFEI